MPPDAVMRAHPSTLPPSGAWVPGDPGGRAPASCASPTTGRSCSRAAACSSTSRSPTRRGASSNAAATNAVLVCHALTGDSHAAGDLVPGHPTPGWWNPVIGPGKPIDTDRFFVVCANVLGGCQGTTGPASPHPDDGRPYAARVPGRHDPRLGAHPGRGGRPPRHPALAHRRRRLDGRDEVLEWAVMYPDRVRVDRADRLVRGGHARSRSAGGRRAARSSGMDPQWRGGDYYDAGAGRRSARGAGPRPHDQPDHVPQRRRVHRSLRPRGGRAPQGRLRPVAALRGRALPRAPRRQARAALRRQHLPAADQGHGPARRGPGPRRGRGGVRPDPVPGAGHGRQLRRALPELPVARDPRPRSARRPASTPSTSRSRARTATTPS